jgi:hypothetical protein
MPKITNRNCVLFRFGIIPTKGLVALATQLRRGLAAHHDFLPVNGALQFDSFSNERFANLSRPRNCISGLCASFNEPGVNGTRSEIVQFLQRSLEFQPFGIGGSKEPCPMKTEPKATGMFAYWRNAEVRSYHGERQQCVQLRTSREHGLRNYDRATVRTQAVLSSITVGNISTSHYNVQVMRQSIRSRCFLSSTASSVLPDFWFRIAASLMNLPSP